MSKYNTLLNDNLLDELVILLKTYNQRLECLERTFHDSGEEIAFVIMKNFKTIRIENQRAVARLQAGLNKYFSNPESERINGGVFASLSAVWKTERMKTMYTMALQNTQAGSVLCVGWKDRPEVLQAMAKHNLDIMGEDAKAHISIFTYSGLVKDHLFNLKNILAECLKKAITASSVTAETVQITLRRIESLIDWLDSSPNMLLCAKNLKVSAIPEDQRTAIASEFLLRTETFNLPVHNRLDAEKAEIFLGSKHILFRLIHGGLFKNDIWEFGKIEEIDTEEGDDDCTFNFYGVGLRK
ncbi:hypothetical protein BIW11_12102, partial [Tropilaelaps mercedesae]